MTTLVWDDPANRMYETGLDKGVLYLPDGSAVPWNGLTSIIESSDKEASPVYYDGMKINELVTLGDFTGTLHALTYPDEFLELEGFFEIKPGVLVGDQQPKLFGLSYRTQIGSAEQGTSVGYKIHIIYNLIAVPNDKTYATVSDSQTISEFEWSITAVPEEIPGFRPTAHIILNSLDLDPWLLEAIETILYGSKDSDPYLMSMHDLIIYMSTWHRLKIIANGDGTWTAVAETDGFIQMLTPDTFEIDNANAQYLNADTFVISDTDGSS